ncbi:MAG: hypothetical protein AB1714_15235 [Acidobacteriota bacterium]
MDVGRIFFDNPKMPSKASVVPLQSHVDSVVALAEAWNDAVAYRVPAECDLSQTRERLARAARRHDEAKPRSFRLLLDGDGRWTYSFAGHRFRVHCDDIYEDALIKMHHEFSVDGVAEWQARLRRLLGDVYARNFPFDLYALEMCDQVAAEAESYALQGHTEERVFMELHSRQRSASDLEVEMEPFPFARSPLDLCVRHAEFEIAEQLRDPEKVRRALREWTPEAHQEKVVRLWRP